MSRALVAGCLYALMSSCAPETLAPTSSGACTPGRVEACLCADGTTSTHTCGVDNVFDECVCPGGPIPDGGDVAVAEAAVMDVSDDVLRDALDAATLDSPGIDAPPSPGDVPAAEVASIDARGIDVAGCDANLQTSGDNCGSCGHRCASGELCVMGRCAPVTAACPSRCADSVECRSCLTPGDRGTYCCMSGVCVYAGSATCPMMSFDAGMTSDAPTGPRLDTGGGRG